MIMTQVTKCRIHGMQYRLPGSYHGNRDRDLCVTPIYRASDLSKEFARVVCHCRLFSILGLHRDEAMKRRIDGMISRSDGTVKNKD